jgi:paraquat-inducible protein B
MTDPSLDQLPEAITEEGSRFSLVWLIPILALVIGGWLVYKSYSEKGPTITISFSEAEGLEPGKTRVRYKNVDVGKVKRIELNEDLSHVEVTVELKKSIGSHLNENTQFWIVSPRINPRGISGLNTLISGIYIGMDPGEGGAALSHYNGRTEPLPIKSDAAGKPYVLTADSLGSLDIGSGIYYRQIQVGEVTGYHLDSNGRSVVINIFINAPYDQLIHENSRFWNASGFDLRLTSEGVSARLESLSALLTGGIGVDTPHNLEAGALTVGGERFALLPDHASIENKPYSLTEYYVLYFDSSIRGLHIGATVEFRGIQVGEVIDIDVQMDHRTLEVRIPVLIALHPDLITVSGDIGSPESVLETLVTRGLRAQLASGNLLTGQLFVDLDFLEEVPDAQITQSGPFRVFPTVPGAMEKLTRNATELLNKIGNVPLVEITNDLRDTIKALRGMIESPASKNAVTHLATLLDNTSSLAKKLDRAVPTLAKRIESSLTQAEKTLATADATLSEDSPLIYDIRLLIDQLSSAINSFEALTDYLERHPNALLYGKTIDTP